MSTTRDLADMMKLVDEALDQLEFDADVHVEAKRDFVDEMLDMLEAEELTFKQRLRVKDARTRLERVLRARIP